MNFDASSSKLSTEWMDAFPWHSPSMYVQRWGHSGSSLWQDFLLTPDNLKQARVSSKKDHLVVILNHPQLPIENRTKLIKCFSFLCPTLQQKWNTRFGNMLQMRLSAEVRAPASTLPLMLSTTRGTELHKLAWHHFPTAELKQLLLHTIRAEGLKPEEWIQKRLVFQQCWAPSDGAHSSSYQRPYPDQSRAT